MRAQRNGFGYSGTPAIKLNSRTVAIGDGYGKSFIFYHHEAHDRIIISLYWCMFPPSSIRTPQGGNLSAS